MSKGATLRQLILRYLDKHILSKPEEQRTGLENFIVENGRALADALHRHEQANPSSSDRFALDTSAGPNKCRTQVTGILRRYNEINAEEARRNVDADAAEVFRGSSDEYADSGDR